MRWNLLRFVGAFLGVVLSLIGGVAAVITIGQFAGFLPEHIVLTLPSLPSPGNPLVWAGLLIAAIATTIGGILLWGRSVVPAHQAFVSQDYVVQDPSQSGE